MFNGKIFFSCAAWIQAVRVEDFLQLNSNILHKKKYVCSCHFTIDDYSSSLRVHLKRTAVPSVFDKKTIPISDEKMSQFFSSQIIDPTICK